MGAVYRARDARLNRDVALKVLPDLFAQDPDRLARFKREAQVLASLNHPNIEAIYGFEETDQIQALVLELVEGPTLAERIAHGPIPLDEALSIARQLVEALEAAHDAGIVHRDFKPANIKVRADGDVKVLDFGLAKAMDLTGSVPADALNSPTLTAHATHMGVILGTAAYMAPEQAKGRPVDRRADIWAFGVVLYEMLTGQRAFKGDDISDTLAAVLRENIDWTELPASTPRSVRRLLARCLERDPKRRLRDIGEARIVLEDLTLGESRSEVDAHESRAILPARTRFRWRPAIVYTLLTMALGALAAGAAWKLKPSTPDRVFRFAVTIPSGHVFAGLNRRMVAISPDGTQVAYSATPLGGTSKLYMRSMSDLSVQPIEGTDGLFPQAPVFSPDGQWIAFQAAADQTLKKIAVNGGVAVALCPIAAPTGGMSWGTEGILFGEERDGILRVWPNGGTPDVLVHAKDGEHLSGPELLPGGRHVMFTLVTGDTPDRWDNAQLVVQAVSSGERKTLLNGSDARYVPTGHLVYAVAGRLFTVAFDLQSLEIQGSPVPIVDGVRRGESPPNAVAHFTLASSGTLAYIPGPVLASQGLRDIALSDRQGNVEILKLPPGPYLLPRISPDGKRLVFGTDDGKEAILWTYELAGTSSMQRVTFQGNNRFAIWSADGKRLVFQSDREKGLGIFWQSADGASNAERLTTPEQGASHVPESSSPAGDSFLFSVIKGSSAGLWTYSLRGLRSSPPFRRCRFQSTPCFHQTAAGWPITTPSVAGPRYISNPSPQPAPDISFPRDALVRIIRCGRRTGRNYFTTPAPARSKPSA